MLRIIFPFLVLTLICLPTSVVHSDEAAEQLILATYKLANGASTASGLAIRYDTADRESNHCMVTANHVLAQMTGDHCVLVTRKQNEDGAFERLEVRVPIRHKEKKLWTQHASHDLAALPLPESVKVDSLPWDCLASEQSLADVHAGDAVRLAVYPERSEANEAGFPVLRGGCIASYPLLPVNSNPKFLVDTASWKGDSGGPVMHTTLRSASGGPLVVGLVHGMRNITDTVIDSRFTERRTHYPLDISEVIHAALVRELLANELGQINDPSPALASVSAPRDESLS